MPSHGDIMVRIGPERARLHAKAATGPLDQKHGIWSLVVKGAVQRAQEIHRGGFRKRSFRITAVDHPLNVDMCPSLDLEVAARFLPVEIVRQSAFDVARLGVMAL